jgi:hypothetical protein
MSMAEMNAEETQPPQSDAQDSCRLEIWGESTPRLSPKYGRASLPHEDTTEIFIYEYFWTLRIFRPDVERDDDAKPVDSGLRGAPGRHGIFRRQGMQRKMEFALPQGYTGSAHVHLLFPHTCGFWIHEIAASVKLLSPPPLDFAEKVGKDVTAVQPLMGLAGGAVAAVGAVGGPLVSAAGHVLSAVAKVKMNDVPSTPEFPWSVQKSSVRSGSQEWDGIVWNLPGDMFEFCGDRITGSVAVVFLPGASGDELKPTKIDGQALFEQRTSTDPQQVTCSFLINPTSDQSAS